MLKGLPGARWPIGYCSAFDTALSTSNKKFSFPPISKKKKKKVKCISQLSQKTEGTSHSHGRKVSIVEQKKPEVINSRFRDFPGGAVAKTPLCAPNTGGLGSIPGRGSRSYML